MLTNAIVILVTLFMRFGPDIPLKAALNRHLAERPVAFLLSRERYQYLALMIGAAVLLVGGEFVLMLGPEFILAYAADVALYLDLVVVGTLVSSAVALRGALGAGVRALRFGRRAERHTRTATPRAKRTRRAASTPPPTNDDEDGPGRRRAYPSPHRALAA